MTFTLLDLVVLLLFAAAALYALLRNASRGDPPPVVLVQRKGRTYAVRRDQAESLARPGAARDTYGRGWLDGRFLAATLVALLAGVLLAGLR